MSSSNPHRPAPPFSDRVGEASVRVSRVRRVTRVTRSRPGQYTSPQSLLAANSGNVSRPQIPSFEHMFPGVEGPSPLSLPGAGGTGTPNQSMLSRPESNRGLFVHLPQANTPSLTPEAERPRPSVFVPLEEGGKKKKTTYVRIPQPDPLTTDTSLLTKQFRAYKVVTVVMLQHRNYSLRDQPRLIAGQAMLLLPLKRTIEEKVEKNKRNPVPMIHLLIRPSVDTPYLFQTSQHPAALLSVHVAHCLTGGIEKIKHVSVTASTFTAVHDGLVQFLSSPEGVSLVLPHLYTLKDMAVLGETRLRVLHHTIDAASANARNYMFTRFRRDQALRKGQNSKELPVYPATTQSLEEEDVQTLKNQRPSNWNYDSKKLAHAAHKLLLVSCAGPLTVVFQRQIWARGFVFRCFDDQCRAVSYEHEHYIHNRNTVLAFLCNYNGAIYVQRNQTLRLWRAETLPGLPNLHIIQPAHGVVVLKRMQVPFSFTTQLSEVPVMNMTHLPAHSLFSGHSFITVDIHGIDALLSGSPNIYTDPKAGTHFYIRDHALTCLTLASATKRTFDSLAALSTTLRYNVKRSTISNGEKLISVNANKGMNYTDTLAILASKSVSIIQKQMAIDRSMQYQSITQISHFTPSDLAFVLQCSERMLHTYTHFLSSAVQFEEQRYVSSCQNVAHSAIALKQLILNGVDVSNNQTLELALPMPGSLRQAYCVLKRMKTLSTVVTHLPTRALLKLIPKESQATQKALAHLLRVLVQNMSAVQLQQPDLLVLRNAEKIALFAALTGILHTHIKQSIAKIKTVNYPHGLRKQIYIKLVENSYAAVYTHLRSLNRHRTKVDVLRIVTEHTKTSTAAAAKILSYRRTETLPGVYPVIAVTPKVAPKHAKRRYNTIVGGVGDPPSIDMLDQPVEVAVKLRQLPSLLLNETAETKAFDAPCRNPTSLFVPSSDLASCTCGYCDSFSSLKTLMNTPWDIFGSGKEQVHMKVALLRDALDHVGVENEQEKNMNPVFLEDYLFGTRCQLLPSVHPYALTRMDLYNIQLDEDPDVLWQEHGNRPDRYNDIVCGLFCLNYDSWKEGNIVIEAEAYPKYHEDHGAGPGVVTIQNYECTYSEYKATSGGSCEYTIHTPIHVVSGNHVDSSLASTILEVEGDVGSIQDQVTETHHVEMNIIKNIPKKVSDQDSYSRMYCDVGAHRYRCGLGGIDVDSWKRKNPTLCAACEAQFLDSDTSKTARNVLMRELGEPSAAEVSDILGSLFVNAGIDVSGFVPLKNSDTNSKNTSSNHSKTLNTTNSNRSNTSKPVLRGYTSHTSGTSTSMSGNRSSNDNSTDIQPIYATKCVKLTQTNAHVPQYLSSDRELIIPRYSSTMMTNIRDNIAVTRRLHAETLSTLELQQLLGICPNTDLLQLYLGCIYDYSVKSCLKRTFAQLLVEIELLHKQHSEMIRVTTSMLNEQSMKTPIVQRPTRTPVCNSSLNSSGKASNVIQFSFPKFTLNTLGLKCNSKDAAQHRKQKITEEIVLQKFLPGNDIGLDLDQRTLRNSLQLLKGSSIELLRKNARVYQKVYVQLKDATRRFLDSQLDRVLQDTEDVTGTPLMMPFLSTELGGADSNTSQISLPTLLIHKPQAFQTPVPLSHPGLFHVVQRKTPDWFVDLLLETSGAGFLTTSFLTKLTYIHIRQPVLNGFNPHLPASLNDFASPRSIRDIVSSRGSAWKLNGLDSLTLEPISIPLPKSAQFSSFSALAVALRLYIEVDFTKHAHVWAGMRDNLRVPLQFQVSTIRQDNNTEDYDGQNPLSTIYKFPNFETNSQHVSEYIDGLVSLTDTTILLLPPIYYAKILNHVTLPKEAVLLPPNLRLHRAELWIVCLKLNIDPSLATTYLIRAIESKASLKSSSSVLHSLQSIHGTTLSSIPACVDILREILIQQWVTTLSQSTRFSSNVDEEEHNNPILALLGDLLSYNYEFTLGDALRKSTPYFAAVALCQHLVNEDLVWRLLKDTCTADQQLPILRSILLSMHRDVNLNEQSELHASQKDTLASAPSLDKLLSSEYLQKTDLPVHIDAVRPLLLHFNEAYATIPQVKSSSSTNSYSLSSILQHPALGLGYILPAIQTDSSNTTPPAVALWATLYSKTISDNPTTWVVPCLSYMYICKIVRFAYLRGLERDELTVKLLHMNLVNARRNFCPTIEGISPHAMLLSKMQLSMEYPYYLGRHTSIIMRTKATPFSSVVSSPPQKRMISSTSVDKYDVSVSNMHSYVLRELLPISGKYQTSNSLYNCLVDCTGEIHPKQPAALHILKQANPQNVLLLQNHNKDGQVRAFVQLAQTDAYPLHHLINIHVPDHATYETNVHVSALQQQSSLHRLLHSTSTGLKKDASTNFSTDNSLRVPAPTGAQRIQDSTQTLPNLFHVTKEIATTPLALQLQPHISTTHVPYIFNNKSLPKQLQTSSAVLFSRFPNDISTLLPPHMHYWNPQDPIKQRIDMTKFTRYYHNRCTTAKFLPYCPPLFLKLGKKGWLGRFKRSVRTCLREGLYERNSNQTQYDYSNIVMTVCPEDFMSHRWRVSMNAEEAQKMQLRLKLRAQLKKSGFSVRLDHRTYTKTSKTYTHLRSRALIRQYGKTAPELHELDPPLYDRSLAKAQLHQLNFYKSKEFGSIAYKLHKSSTLRGLMLDVHPAFHNYKVGPCLTANYFGMGSRQLNVTLLGSAIILGDIRTAMSSVSVGSTSSGVLCERTFFRKGGYAIINVPRHALHGHECILRMVGGGEWCYGANKLALFQDYMLCQDANDSSTNIHILQLSSFAKHMHKHRISDDDSSKQPKLEDDNVEVLGAMLFPSKRTVHVQEITTVSRVCLRIPWTMEFVRGISKYLSTVTLNVSPYNIRSQRDSHTIMSGPWMLLTSVLSIVETEIDACVERIQEYLQSSHCFVLFVPERHLPLPQDKNVIVHGDPSVANLALKTAEEDDLTTPLEFHVDEKTDGPIQLNALHYPVPTSLHFPYELFPVSTLLNFGKSLPAEDAHSVQRTMVLYNKLQSTNLDITNLCQGCSHPVYILQYLHMQNEYKFRFQSFEGLASVLESMVEDYRLQHAAVTQQNADFNLPGLSKYTANYSILSSPLATLNPIVTTDKLFSCFKFDPLYICALLRECSLTTSFQDPILASKWINEKYDRDRDQVFEFLQNNLSAFLLKAKRGEDVDTFKNQLATVGEKIQKFEMYHVGDALPDRLNVELFDFNSGNNNNNNNNIWNSNNNKNNDHKNNSLDVDSELNLLDANNSLNALYAHLIEDVPEETQHTDEDVLHSGSVYHQPDNALEIPEFIPFQAYLHGLIESFCLPHEILHSRRHQIVLVPHVQKHFDKDLGLALHSDSDSHAVYSIDVMRGIIPDRYSLEPEHPVPATSRKDVYATGLQREFAYIPAFVLKNGKLTLDDADMESMEPVIVDLADAVITPADLLQILIHIFSVGKKFLSVRDLIAYVHYEHTKSLIKTHTYASCLNTTHDLLTNTQTAWSKTLQGHIDYKKLRSIILGTSGVVLDGTDVAPNSFLPVGMPGSMKLVKCARLSKFKNMLVLYAWALSCNTNVDMLNNSKMVLPKTTDGKASNMTANTSKAMTAMSTSSSTSDVATLIPQLLYAFHARAKRFSSIISLRDVLNTQHCYVLLQSNSITKYALKHVSGEDGLSLLRHRPTVIDAMTEGIHIPEDQVLYALHNEIIQSYTGLVMENHIRKLSHNTGENVRNDTGEQHAACTFRTQVSIEEWTSLRDGLLLKPTFVSEDLFDKADVPKASNEQQSILQMKRLLPIFSGSLTRLINVLSDLAAIGISFSTFSALRKYLLLEELHMRQEAALIYCLFTVNSASRVQLNTDQKLGALVPADINIPYSVSKRAGRLDPAWPSLTNTLDPTSPFEIMPCPHNIFTRVPLTSDLGLLLPPALTDPESPQCITQEEVYTMVLESACPLFVSAHQQQILKVQTQTKRVFTSLQQLTAEQKTVHAAFLRQRILQQVEPLVKLQNDPNGPLVAYDNSHTSKEDIFGLESAAHQSSDGLRLIQPAYTPYEKMNYSAKTISHPNITAQEVITWIQSLPPTLATFTLPLLVNQCTYNSGGILVGSLADLKPWLIRHYPKFKVELLEINRWLHSANPLYTAQEIVEHYNITGTSNSPNVCSCHQTKTVPITEPVIPRYHTPPPLAQVTVKANTFLSVKIDNTRIQRTTVANMPIQNPVLMHIYTLNTIPLPSLVHLFPMFDRLPQDDIATLLPLAPKQATAKALALYMVSTYMRQRQEHVLERKKLYSLLKQPMSITSPLARVPPTWELTIMSDKNKQYQHIQGYVKSYSAQERISKASRVTARQRMDNILESNAQNGILSPPKVQSQANKEVSFTSPKQRIQGEPGVGAASFHSPPARLSADMNALNVAKMYAPFPLIDDEEGTSNDSVSSAVMNQRQLIRNIKDWITKRSDIIPLIQCPRWVQSPSNEMALKWLTFPHRMDTSVLKQSFQQFVAYTGDFTPPAASAMQHQASGWLGRALHVALYVRLHLLANQIELETSHNPNITHLTLGDARVPVSSMDDNNVFTMLTGRTLPDIVKSVRSNTKAVAKVAGFRAIPTFEHTLGRTQLWNHVESAALSIAQVRAHFEKQTTPFQEMFQKSAASPATTAWNTIQSVVRPTISAAHTCGKHNLLSALSLVMVEVCMKPSRPVLGTDLHPFFWSQNMQFKKDHFLSIYGRRQYIEDLTGMEDSPEEVEDQFGQMEFCIGGNTPMQSLPIHRTPTISPSASMSSLHEAEPDVDLTQFWLESYTQPIYDQLNPYLQAQFSPDLVAPGTDILAAVMNPSEMVRATVGSLPPSVIHAATEMPYIETLEERPAAIKSKLIPINLTAFFATGSFAVALSKRQHIEPEHTLMLLQTQLIGMSLATRSLPWLYLHARKLIGDTVHVTNGVLDFETKPATNAKDHLDNSKEPSCIGCLLQRIYSIQNLHVLTFESRAKYLSTFKAEYALTMDSLPLIQTLSPRTPADLMHLAHTYLLASSTLQSRPHLHLPVLGSNQKSIQPTMYPSVSLTTLNQVASLTLQPCTQPSDLAPAVAEMYTSNIKPDAPPTLLEVDVLLQTGSTKHLTSLLHFIEICITQNMPMTTPLPSAFTPSHPYAIHADSAHIPTFAGAIFGNMPFIVNSELDSLNEQVLNQMLTNCAPSLIDTQHTKNVLSSGAMRVGKLKHNFLKMLASAPVLEEPLSRQSSLLPPAWIDSPICTPSSGVEAVTSITHFLHNLPITCQYLRTIRFISPYAAANVVPCTSIYSLVESFSFTAPATADHTCVFNVLNNNTVSNTQPIILPAGTSLSRHGMLTACSVVWHYYLQQTKSQLLSLTKIGYGISTPSVPPKPLETYSYIRAVDTQPWLSDTIIQKIQDMTYFGPLTLEFLRILQYRAEASITVVPKGTDMSLLYTTQRGMDNLLCERKLDALPDTVRPRRKQVPTTGTGVDYTLRFQEKEVKGLIPDTYSSYFSPLLSSHNALMDENIALLPSSLHIPEELLPTVLLNMHKERILLRDKLTNLLFHPDCTLLPSLLNVGGCGTIYPVHHRLALCRVIASVLESHLAPVILRDFPSDGGMFKAFLPSHYTVSDGLTGVSEGIVQGTRAHLLDTTQVRKNALERFLQNTATICPQHCGVCINCQRGIATIDQSMNKTYISSDQWSNAPHVTYDIAVKPSFGSYYVLPDTTGMVVNEENNCSEGTNTFLALTTQQHCTCAMSGALYLDSILINGHPLPLTDSLRAHLCPDHGGKAQVVSNMSTPSLSAMKSNASVTPHTKSTLGDVLKTLITQQLRLYMKSDTTLQKKQNCTCQVEDSNNLEKSDLFHVCTCFDRTNNVVLQYKVYSKEKQLTSEMYLNSVGLTSKKYGDILLDLVFQEQVRGQMTSGDHANVKYELYQLVQTLQTAYEEKVHDAHTVYAWLLSKKGLETMHVLLHPFYSSSGDNDSEEDAEEQLTANISTNIWVARASTLHVPFTVTLHTARYQLDVFGTNVLELLNSLHSKITNEDTNTKTDTEVLLRQGHAPGVVVTHTDPILSTPMKTSLRASLRQNPAQQTQQDPSARTSVPFLLHANKEAVKQQQQRSVVIHSTAALVRALRGIKEDAAEKQRFEEEEEDSVFPPMARLETTDDSLMDTIDHSSMNAVPLPGIPLSIPLSTPLSTPPPPLLPTHRENRPSGSPFPVMYLESIFEKE